MMYLTPESVTSGSSLLLAVIVCTLVQLSEPFEADTEDPECLDPDNYYPTTIEPIHVYASDGAPLTISCRVDTRCRSRYNASNLYFLKAVPEFYTNSSRVRLVSPFEIALDFPALQEWRDRGLWMCLVDQVRGNGLTKYTSHIDFRHPIKPAIDGCMVMNWEVTTCHWSPTYQEQVRQTLDDQFQYKMIYSSGTILPEYCRSDTDMTQYSQNLFGNTCQLHYDTNVSSFQMGFVYNVTVRAESGSSYRVGHLTNFDTQLHVKPNPPENVSLTTYNRSHSYITWSPPTTTWTPARTWTLNYSITVTSKYQNVTVYTTDTRYLLAVHPHTTYAIRVRVRTVQGGYWSDETLRHLATKTRAPDTNPEVFPSSYEYSDDSCTENCLVTVYWKPLSEWQVGGYNCSYHIIARMTTSGEENNGNLSTMKVAHNYRIGSAVLTVSAWQHTEVTITTRNDDGDSPRNEDSIYIEPSNQRLPITETLVVEGSQEPDGDNDGSLVYLWLDSAKSYIDHSATYTVFWKKTDNKDDGVPDHGWVVLPRHGDDESAAIIRLPHHYRRYAYSLSKDIRLANGRMRTSGLVRQHGCLYEHGSESEAAPPRNVQIIHATMTSLTLTWTTPDCVQDTAYIASYHVYYCQKDNILDNCKQPTCITEMHVSANKTRIIVSDLKPGTPYLVYMSSQSYHSNKPSVRVMATGPIPAVTLLGLSTGVKVGLFIACVFAVVMSGLGIRCYWRKCSKIKKWYKKGIAIKLPTEHIDSHLPEDSPLEQSETNGRMYLMSETSVDSGRYSANTSDMGGATRRPHSLTDSVNSSYIFTPYVRCPPMNQQINVSSSSDPGTHDSNMARYNKVAYVDNSMTPRDVHTYEQDHDHHHAEMSQIPSDMECLDDKQVTGDKSFTGSDESGIKSDGQEHIITAPQTYDTSKRNMSDKIYHDEDSKEMRHSPDTDKRLQVSEFPKNSQNNLKLDSFVTGTAGDEDNVSRIVTPEVVTDCIGQSLDSNTSTPVDKSRSDPANVPQEVSAENKAVHITNNNNHGTSTDFAMTSPRCVINAPHSGHITTKTSDVMNDCAPRDIPMEASNSTMTAVAPDSGNYVAHDMVMGSPRGACITESMLRNGYVPHEPIY